MAGEFSPITIISSALLGVVSGALEAALLRAMTIQSVFSDKYFK